MRFEYLFNNNDLHSFIKPRIIESDFEKVILYKWTSTYELCFQRGYKPVNCTAPKQNKKFIE